MNYFRFMCYVLSSLAICSIFSCGFDTCAGHALIGEPYLVVEPNPETTTFEHVQINTPQHKSFRFFHYNPPGIWDIVVKKIEIDDGGGAFSIVSSPLTPFTVSETMADTDKKEITVRFLPKRNGIFKGSIVLTWDSRRDNETPWGSKSYEMVKINSKTIIPLTHKDRSD